MNRKRKKHPPCFFLLKKWWEWGEWLEIRISLSTKNFTGKKYVIHEKKRGLRIWSSHPDLACQLRSWIKSKIIELQVLNIEQLSITSFNFFFCVRFLRFYLTHNFVYRNFQCGTHFSCCTFYMKHDIIQSSHFFVTYQIIKTICTGYMDFEF